MSFLDNRSTKAIFVIVPIIILIFFGPLTCSAAYGSGQGGMLSVMSGGGFMVPIGMNMPGVITGLLGMGTVSAGNYIGQGFPASVAAPYGQLSSGQYITAGNIGNVIPGMSGAGGGIPAGMANQSSGYLPLGPIAPFSFMVQRPYTSPGMQSGLPNMNLFNMPPMTINVGMLNMYPYYGAMQPYYGAIPPYLSTGYGFPLASAFGDLIRTQAEALGTYGTSIIPGFETTYQPYYPYPYTPFPVPYFPGAPTISSTVVRGHVRDMDNGQPIEGVQVAVGTETNVKALTFPDGYYELSLYSGTHDFFYIKDGYETKHIEDVVIQRYSPQQLAEIFLETKVLPKPPNQAPVLEYMSPIEVIAGDVIILDPQASDPDPNDQLTFTFSGWMDTNTYVTTQNDIGVDWVVTITVEDLEGLSDFQDVLISVYPGYDLSLYIGLNLISYPFEEDGDPNFSAYDLLQMLGDANQIVSVECYDEDLGMFKKAWYGPGGQFQGTDFPIQVGDGYYVYANGDQTKTVFNRYTGETQYLDLVNGLNLIGIASYPEGYTSYDLLWELGYGNVQSVYRYDAYWGQWRSTYWSYGSPAGDEFPILIGEGYMIQMQTDQGLTLSRQRSFTF